MTFVLGPFDADSQNETKGLIVAFLRQVGDKVLSVNGASLVEVDHYYAVEVLKASGHTLTLVITRDSPNSTR